MPSCVPRPGGLRHTLHMMIYEAQIRNLTSSQGQVNTLTTPKQVVQCMSADMLLKKNMSNSTIFGFLAPPYHDLFGKTFDGLE